MLKERSEVCLIVIFRLSQILLCCATNPEWFKLRSTMSDLLCDLIVLYAHVHIDKCLSMCGNGHAHSFLPFYRLVNEGQCGGDQKRPLPRRCIRNLTDLEHFAKCEQNLNLPYPVYSFTLSNFRMFWLLPFSNGAASELIWGSRRCSSQQQHKYLYTSSRCCCPHLSTNV